MKTLSDITAAGFANNTSAFAPGGGTLPQHNTTPAEALENELNGNGYVDAYNTFLGQDAGSLVSVGTTGSVLGGRNLAIGYKAGSANTSGWQNTGVGFISLMKTTSGIYNTGLGAYTLVENTTGTNNTGLGADALWKNISGHNNTAIGAYAGQLNETGMNNTVIGVNALRYGTTATGSVAVGVEALRDNTGQDNTAIGLEAGRLNQGGQNNSIFGARAFWKSVTGNENVAFGPYTLFNANGASRNIAIGFGALETLTTGLGNVSIGYFSSDVVTDGELNTFIGYQAGLTTTTGDRNILIGNGVNASAAGASDEINIGNVIYADRTSGTISGKTNAGANPVRVPLVNWLMQTADYTLTNSAAEQKAFNTTANAALTLPAGVYRFEAFLHLTTMSATSGNLSFDPVGAGSAVTDRWGQITQGIDNTSPLAAGTRTGSASVTQLLPASALTAGTGTGAALQVRGMFRISTGGTIIPSVMLVTAAAAVMKAGSHFQIEKIGEVGETSLGAWS